MPILVPKPFSVTPYDFNDTWRVQVDFQSGSDHSSTIGFVWSINDDIQVNLAIYVTNDSSHEVVVTCLSLTHFPSGAAENNAAQFVLETGRQ